MPRQARKTDIERALRAAGFSPVRGGRGTHDKWRLGRHTVAVPRSTSDLAPGTFASIRKQAGKPVLVVCGRTARAGTGITNRRR